MPTRVAPLHEHRPLAAYGGFTAVFGAALGGALVALRASGRELPERPATADLILTGVATHKLARLLSRDRISSFIPYCLLADFLHVAYRAAHERT